VPGDGLGVDPAHPVLELGEPQFFCPQVPDDEEVPLAPDDINDVFKVAFLGFFTFHANLSNTLFLEIMLQKHFWCI
jgi:hypothetical protein